MSNNTIFIPVKGDGYCFFRAIHASLGLDNSNDIFNQTLRD